MEIKEATKMTQTDGAIYKIKPRQVTPGQAIERVRRAGDLLITVYGGCAPKKRNIDIVDQINRAFKICKRGK